MKLWNSNNRSEKEQLLLSVLIRFGKTHPSMLPGWDKDTGLPFCTINVAWLAAQLKFGNLWRIKEKRISEEEDQSNINDYFKPLSAKPKNFPLIPLTKLGPNRDEANVASLKTSKEVLGSKKVPI